MVKPSHLWLSLLGLTLFLSSSPGQAPGTAAPPNLYLHTLRGTAWVIAPEVPCHGTACLIDRQRRLLLTAYHVVRESNRVWAVFPVTSNGKLVARRTYYWNNSRRMAIPGKVLLRDARRDLVLIQLDYLPRFAAALPLAHDSPKRGERLSRMGSPAAEGGEAWKSSTGLVARVELRHLTYPSGQQVQARMVVNGIPPRYGDSGSPVVNARGELVALHASGDSGGRSCSIDVREIRAFLARARSV